MKRLILFLLIINSISVFSQNWTKNNNFYISWGYNRSHFALSNIHLTGPGYDFKLKGVHAADRPSKFEPKVYFNPALLSIPQFNFRMGYFINENWAISLGYDHMKYVVEQDQKVPIYGTIDSSATTDYNGIYNGELIKLEQDFLKYEHTDGLNFASIALEYHDHIFQTSKQNFTIDFFGSIEVGGVIPKTWARLFDKRGTDAYHLAGGGIAGSIGSRFYFFKHFYIHIGGKTGILFMPNVATNALAEDKASQNINFYEGYFQFGGIFSLSKK